MDEKLLKKQQYELNPAAILVVKRFFDSLKGREPTVDESARMLAEAILCYRYGPGAGEIKPSDFRSPRRTQMQARIDALEIGQEVRLLGHGARVATHRARRKFPGRTYVCTLIASHPDPKADKRKLDRFRVVRLADGGMDA